MLAADRAVISAIRSQHRQKPPRSKQQERGGKRLGRNTPSHEASRLSAAYAVTEDDGSKLKPATRRPSPWDPTAAMSKYTRAPAGLASMLSRHASGSQTLIHAASSLSPMPFDRRGSGDECLSVSDTKTPQHIGRKPFKAGRRRSSEDSDGTSYIAINGGDPKPGRRRQSQLEAKRQSREAKRLQPPIRFSPAGDEYLTMGGKDASGTPASRSGWMSSPPEDVHPVCNFTSSDVGIDPLEILFGQDIRDFESSDPQAARTDLIRAARSQSTSPINPLPFRSLTSQQQQPYWSEIVPRTRSAASIGLASTERSPPTVHLQPLARISPLQSSGREHDLHLDLARSRLRPSQHYRTNQHVMDVHHADPEWVNWGHADGQHHHESYFDVGESPYQELGPGSTGGQ